MKESIHKWLTEQFGNDDELFEDLYAQYAADMKSRAAKLPALLDSGKIVALGEEGHAMKGSALQMGDNETADPCKALQDAGRHGDVDGCAALIPRIQALIAAL